MRAAGVLPDGDSARISQEFPKIHPPVRGGANRGLTCFLAHDLLLLTV
jgi:hypothetical protein